MRIRPLDLQRMFHPKSIAFIGVSRSTYKFGGLSFLSKYLEAGYRGRLYPINPKTTEVLGIRAWRALDVLPEIPELAMVAVPSGQVPEVLEAGSSESVMSTSSPLDSARPTPKRGEPWKRGLSRFAGAMASS